MNKAQRSFKILIFGVVSQIVTLLLGIIIPRLVILNYGSEINGLLSSVRQVFVYISLLEAGIGTAALQAMYGPIARNDKNGLSAIMTATDRYYKRTGVLYGAVVILLALLYPVVVKSNLPNNVVVAVILLQGMSGVIKYFFQGKWTILLRVDGRGYITTNAATIVNVASHAAQIALILLGADIVAVYFSYFVITLGQMLYIIHYAKRNYGWLNDKAEPNYSALSQSKNVIIHQVSGLIFNNTDILILTYFCGLKVVSVYSLYALVINCVSNIIDSLSSSVEFVLGQTFNSDRERFLRLQETYETYYLGGSFSFFTITLLLFPSFIKLYSSGIMDTDYNDAWLPYLFVAVNVLMYARRPSSQIINFAGCFRQTQWRSILESAINLSVSLGLVRNMGIYGVLIGTVAALLYRTNDIIIYANSVILKRSPWSTYRRWLQNTAIMAVCTITIRPLIPPLGSYYAWLFCAVWVSILCFAIFLLVDSALDVQSFKMARGYLFDFFR